MTLSNIPFLYATQNCNFHIPILTVIVDGSSECSCVHGISPSSILLCSTWQNFTLAHEIPSITQAMSPLHSLMLANRNINISYWLRHEDRHVEHGWLLSGHDTSKPSLHVLYIDHFVCVTMLICLNLSQICIVFIFYNERLVSNLKPLKNYKKSFFSHH